MNILKGYMESGEFSRGKESIRADGGIVMVGNFEVDVEDELRRWPPLRAHAEGDAQRHRLPRPDPRIPSRLGRSQARPNLLHRPFWVRQRFPVRVLDPTPTYDSRLDVIQGRLEWGAQLRGRDRLRR